MSKYMGMFDWIRFQDECPNCGELLSGCWQSKDRYCQLEQLKPHKVENFYTSCRHCKVWIDYQKEYGSKKWTRRVTSDFRNVHLDQHDAKFSKKYLKQHTTELEEEDDV